MKLITYNVWHGLNGHGIVSFGELEPRGRHEKRILWQLQEIKKLDPDILVLQEMNPVRELSDRFAKDLDMKAIHQVDQSGLRLLGFGIPLNLTNGLTILAKSELRLKKLSGLKLSGPFGFCSDLASIQFQEFRFALISEFTYQGEKITLANVHLHHGPVLTEEFLKDLENLYHQKNITKKEMNHVIAQMKQSVPRRLKELDRLLDWCEKNRRTSKLIIAGDFNDSEDSPLFKKLNSAGLKEAYKKVHPKQKANTWDGSKNKDNHILTNKLFPPIEYFKNEKLLELLRRHDERPRRLDYICMTETLVSKVKDACEVFNIEVDGLLGSDHFGIQVEI